MRNLANKPIFIFITICLMLASCSVEDGDVGAPVLDGINGIDGINGQDGEDGLDGLDGMDGTDGVDGAAGQDDNATFLLVDGYL